jgi:D-tyrosyl-tRNA(Tyr) deacylase
MIGLLQRVSSARVLVAREEVGAIGRGLLVLVGICNGDDERKADRLLERVLSYRVFPDEQDRMNLSLSDIHGELLLVPQFTLAANTRKGTRASFTGAAPPQDSHRLFEYLVERSALQHPRTQSGVFGADMQVSLTNDGPVTFWIET